MIILAGSSGSTDDASQKEIKLFVCGTREGNVSETSVAGDVITLSHLKEPRPHVTASSCIDAYPPPGGAVAQMPSVGSDRKSVYLPSVFVNYVFTLTESLIYTQS